jgi:NADPH-dependent ferric siderophore reductase
MRRVTVTGADLATFVWSGPAAHIKIIPPQAGSTKIELPIPEGPRPAAMRTYTPRGFDAPSATLTVDFLLHHAGPAAGWAARAQLGDPLVIFGPGRAYVVDETAPWYVLAGDQSALPAIETIIEALPATLPVVALVEISDLAERRPLAGYLDADVRWLVRDPARPPGSALAHALDEFTWPPGSGRVYLGCETAAVRRLRDSVREKASLPPSNIVARGYWQIGVGNQPDHDYVID